MDAVNVVSVKSIIEKSGVCFGTSGIRGLVSDMTDQVCWIYVTAFLQEITPTAKKVVLGHDLRPSSPNIARICAAAIHNLGMEVLFAGALPTPALALYALQENIPAIMVTGSHIPFDRNGIKFYSPTGEISKAQERIITNAMVASVDNYILPELEAFSAPIDCYQNRYLQFFPPHFLQGMRIGVYEHSSVARDFLSKLLLRFGAEVISLGRSDDFVPLDTEAVTEHDQRLARNWVEEYQLDALLSTDGDADRPLISDETGHWLRGDIVGLLCAKYLIANTVVTPVSSTTAIESCGTFSTVIRTKIGSPYVIEAMEERLANGDTRVVGFEANGGFLVGDMLKFNSFELSPLLTRDAVLPILALLALAKSTNLPLSKLYKSLPCRFTASDRIKNFPQENSEKIIRHLAKSHIATQELLDGICGKSVITNEIDGLRLTYETGEIIHLRSSGNAPELRCYAEADTDERANFLVKKVLDKYRE